MTTTPETPALPGDLTDAAMKLAALTLGLPVSGSPNRTDLAHRVLRLGIAAAGVAPAPDNGLCGGCRDLGPHRNVPGCDYYEPEPAPDTPRGEASAEDLLGMICLAAEEPQGNADDVLGDIVLLISDHWGQTETDEEVDRARELRESLAGDILAERRSHGSVPIVAPVTPSEDDERIAAWENVARHPALRQCYDEERPLLASVLDRLTELVEIEVTVNELSPAPPAVNADRIRTAVAKAVTNAYNHPVPAHVLGRNLSALIDATTEAVLKELSA